MNKNTHSQREMTDPRPPFGDPCNHCGMCCKEQICAWGSSALRLVEKLGDRVPGPCPAQLEVEPGVFKCGLAIKPKFFTGAQGPSEGLRETAALLIGAGLGCDAAGLRETPPTEAQLQQMRSKSVEMYGEDILRDAALYWQQSFVLRTGRRKVLHLTPIDFRKTRERLGVSTNGLAELLGMTGGTIRRFESGEYEVKPAIALLMRLLDGQPPPDLAPYKRGPGRPRSN